MAIDTSQLEGDLSGAVSDLPTPFTISGNSYQGIFTDLTVGNELEAGGLVSAFDAQIYAVSSIFSVAPAIGITVGVGVRTFRLDAITYSPDNIATLLSLITPDK